MNSNMTEETKELLYQWARTYHKQAFIKDDPVQFPHRYSDRNDIEISGLLTAILSFGSRKQIIRKAEELDSLMHRHPHAYVMSRQWEHDFPTGKQESFYRMLSYGQFRNYFTKLYEACSQYGNLENALLQYQGTPMERLCCFLGVSSKSPQKKLNMFLRWMIRKDSEVDFGIWAHFDAKDLIIPLDTHVCQTAFQLGLIDKPQFSLQAARKITQALCELFPDDPCMGDFALFGYGADNNKTSENSKR